MVKRNGYICETIGVRDTTNGKFYTKAEIDADPKLKEYIEVKMTENICKAIGAVPC